MQRRERTEHLHSSSWSYNNTTMYNGIHNKRLYFTNFTYFHFVDFTSGTWLTYKLKYQNTSGQSPDLSSSHPPLTPEGPLGWASCQSYEPDWTLYFDQMYFKNKLSDVGHFYFVKLEIFVAFQLRKLWEVLYYIASCKKKINFCYKETKLYQTMIVEM